MKNKLETISKIFEGQEIRSVWDKEREEYYFSVVDVIKVLTDSPNPRKYWSVLKTRLKNEGSELTTFCSQLKLKSLKDGKKYLTDTLDTKGILRLIESVPSPKAEPFKIWLASLGSERIDEVFNPSKGIDKMLDYYLMRGYSLEWIEQRIKAIINRKKLTSTWKENGIIEDYEYGILTNEIYKEWSGMTAKEYKPVGLNENKKIAKMGGSAAKAARDNIEKNLKKSIISSDNKLKYKYINEDKLIENK